ncbi:acyl-CoA carboxylase subunit epsilon [Arthrobacter sp. HLT1-21]
MTIAPTQAEDAADDDSSAPRQPSLTVVRGTPTPEELAALTAVVVALSEGSTEPDLTTTTQRTWARRKQLRLAPRPGPGSWRRSVR